jgi:hypothetical protein
MASPSVLRPGTPDAWRISFTGRWPESAVAIVKPERSERRARDEDHGRAGRVGDRCLTPPRPGQSKPQQRRSGFTIPTHVLDRGGRGVKTLADALGADLMRKPYKTPANTPMVRNPLVTWAPQGGRRRSLMPTRRQIGGLIWKPPIHYLPYPKWAERRTP